MFKNTFQSGFLSILYSIGSKPLQIWDKQGKRPDMWQAEVTSLADVCGKNALNACFLRCSAQWSHQAHHRQRHPVERAGDYEQQRQHDIHHLSS